MTIIVAIEEATVTTKILAYLGVPTRAPPCLSHKAFGVDIPIDERWYITALKSVAS